MISRREFLKVSAAGAAAAFVASRARFMQNVKAAVSPQVPLPAGAIPQFVDALPALDAILAGTGQIELQMKEFTVPILPAALYPPLSTGTYVWGYLQPGQEGRDSYLGPVIVATRGQPTQIKFVNALGGASETNVLAYRYGTDQTLHWADPLNDEENMWNHMAMPPEPESQGAENYLGSIPACVHLHGGEVPPALDGGPDAWYTSDGSHVGHGFYSKDGNEPKNYSIYRYPNSQEGSPIWFHDHTLGATRLNVYAGLAGGYLVTDPANDPPNLPPLTPLVIQDRMFDSDGQLFFPSDSAGGELWSPNPEHPYWVPEFIGDVICVNGKSWPYLNVAPKRHTFLFVNGSNARGYEMFLSDPVSGNGGPPLWVIGTDGGYLDKPVRVGGAGNNKLVMLPGERYLVIIDFARYQAGMVGSNGARYSGSWILRNIAKAPFPGGDASRGGTTGRIMQFRVTGAPAADTTFNPAVPGATLRGGAGQGPAIVRLVNPATGAYAGVANPKPKVRMLTLNEVMGMPQEAIDPVTGQVAAYEGGPLEILVNNTKWSGERIVGVTDGEMPMYVMEPVPGFTERDNGNGSSTYYSELPQEGETEIWEIVNLTADAHPMHWHLVQAQLMNRQNFDLAKYKAVYAAAFPGGGYDPMTGDAYPPGVYIPGFGPPLDYNTGTTGKLGGNPSISNSKKNTLLKGAPIPPLPHESGWKDTFICYPGQITRVVIRWTPTDVPANTSPTDPAAAYPFDPNGGHGYVWHCHIVDHEDNEMMRPDEVLPNSSATRTYIQGEDY